MICYLYTFPNGKKYCGITKNTIEERAQGKYKGQRVGAAIQKYGWENVKKEILLESNDESLVRQKEIDVITELNLLDTNFGYNVSPGGNYQSESTRIQIGKSIGELWQNKEYRTHMVEAAKNRPYSQERCDKISSTMKQKFLDNPELKIERSEKLKQAYQDGKRVEAQKKAIEARRQPVAKYTMDGNLISIFPTAVEAYREFHPEARSDKAIYRVLNGQRNHYQGFVYKRISKEQEDELNGILCARNNSEEREERS